MQIWGALKTRRAHIYIYISTIIRICWSNEASKRTQLIRTYPNHASEKSQSSNICVVHGDAAVQQHTTQWQGLCNLERFNNRVTPCRSCHWFNRKTNLVTGAQLDIYHFCITGDSLNRASASCPTGRQAAKKRYVWFMAWWPQKSTCTSLRSVTFLRHGGLVSKSG